MNYTDDLKKAISIAQSIAKEFSNNEFSPAHLSFKTIVVFLHLILNLSSIGISWQTYKVHPLRYS